MYVKIGTTEYAKLRDLSFAPETDLTGDTIPINEFRVDILTDDTITIGVYAELYDDLDNLWARYWISYAERVDAGRLRIIAKSLIALLDQRVMAADMYESESVTNVLQDVFEGMDSADWTMSEDFDEVTLTGYVPEQTARERLQWVCFVMGAYVRTYFTDRVWILPIDTTATIVPQNMTLIDVRPVTSFKDWVTAISAKVYSYAQGTPGATDQWVEVGGAYYIQTEQTVTLTNNEAPAAAPANVITIEDMTLLNSSNVSAVLSYLATYYFKRTEVELDVVNNAAYMPGDKLSVYANRSTMYTGFLSKCTFAFGVQARARLRVSPVDLTPSAKLILSYTWDGILIAQRTYTFPVGYSYSISNPYIDTVINGHRYVFRPEAANATGTIEAGTNTNTQACAVALDLYQGVLHIISVDEVTVETDDDVSVGVIS